MEEGVLMCISLKEIWSKHVLEIVEKKYFGKTISLRYIDPSKSFELYSKYSFV